MWNHAYKRLNIFGTITELINNAEIGLNTLEILVLMKILA
jgi:hypothetical protein